MLREVWTKTLRDQRWSIPAWCAALVLLSGMYSAFYPSFHKSQSYDKLVNQLPKALRDFFSAGTGDLGSGPGYVHIELLSFMAPTLLLVFAIGAGAQALAGEEERGTLDLLLATPLHRSRLVVDKLIAIAVGVLALVTAAGAATVVFGMLAGMDLSTPNVVASMVHLALLALVFASLALLVGAATGRVGLARGVPAAVAVLAYMVNGFATTVSWLRPLQKFSPFFQYVGHDPIRHGLSIVGLVVAVVTVLALLFAAVRVFEQRDLVAA